METSDGYFSPSEDKDDLLDGLSSEDEFNDAPAEEGQAQSEDPSHHKKQLSVDPDRQVDKDLLKLCHLRVKRRTELIEKLRQAYLRDVVFLKRVITDNCDESIYATWKTGVPSLDTKSLLWMHNPDETTLGLIPCEVCGGSIEVMHHDSPEIER